MAGKDSRKSSNRKRDKTSSQKRIRKRESNKAGRIPDSDSEHSPSSSKFDHKVRKRKYKKHYSTLSSDYKRKKKKVRQLLANSTKQVRERSDDGEAQNSGKKRKRLSSDYDHKGTKRSSKRKKVKFFSSSSSSQSNSTESHEARKKHKLSSPGVSVSPSDGELVPVNNDSIINNNNNSRRLRSVIVVADRHHYGEVGNRWDPHKEEVLYDPNDFPSPKSLDTNEEGIEMVLDNRSFNESRYNGGALDNDGGCQLQVVDKSNTFEKEKDIVPVGGDVLESILRQKALENMKKFKGGRLQPDGTSADSKVEKPSNVMVGKELTEQGTTNSQETNMNCGPEEKSDACEVKNPSGSENVGGESRIDKCPGGEITDAGGEPSPSSTRLEGENEAPKDGSEFKEKTMSVMRGGEMVQVSYKVYIPKKAPALARKPLRR